MSAPAAGRLVATGRGPSAALYAGLGVLGILFALALVRAGVAPEYAFFGATFLIAAGAAVLTRTNVALLLWMVVALAREPTPDAGPIELYKLGFAAMVVAFAVDVIAGRRDFPRLGGTELMMGLYLAWIMGSMLAPHTFPAEIVGTKEPVSPVNMMLSGTLMPFATFVVARSVLRTEKALRWILWSTLVVGIYSAAMSVLFAFGPRELLFPTSIRTNVVWNERAAGIFNQPVVNGLVISWGLVAAMILAHERGARFRWIPILSVPLLGVAIFETHTRAPLLGTAAILVGGLLFARGFRTGFVAILAATAALIAINWSTFTSSDRSSGGVAQVSEVNARLNGIATSIHAIKEEPLFGWGIGRFQQVSIFEHQQWGNTPWTEGYGEISHETELGIATELGLVGLALWLGVLAAVARGARRATTLLAPGSPVGRWFGVGFFLVAAAWFVNGSTIEMRLFAYANAFVFLWAGALLGRAEEVEAAAPQAPSAARAGAARRSGAAPTARASDAAAATALASTEKRS